jgi:biopolymer transport protein ExbD
MKIPAAWQRKRARIEIIPLIDIMFFLLATFVVVSSVDEEPGTRVLRRTERAPRSLSRARSRSGGRHDPSRPRPGHPAELRGGCRRLADPELAVFINGDERSGFGIAVSIFDRVRLLGIAKVSVRSAGGPGADVRAEPHERRWLLFLAVGPCCTRSQCSIESARRS